MLCTQGWIKYCTYMLHPSLSEIIGSQTSIKENLNNNLQVA